MVYVDGKHHPVVNRVRKQVILPKSLQDDVLTQLHNSPAGGHLGIAKTLEKIKRKVLLGKLQQGHHKMVQKL